MTNDNSEFAAAYEEWSHEAYDNKPYIEIVRRALLLADKVTREPSEGMKNAGFRVPPVYESPSNIFTAMIRAAQEEIAHAD